MTVIIIMNLSLLYRRGRSTCLNTSMLSHQIQSRHVFSPLKIKQVHVQQLCNILRLLPNFKGTKNCFVFSLTKSKSVILSFNVYERKKKKDLKKRSSSVFRKNVFSRGMCCVWGWKQTTVQKWYTSQTWREEQIFRQERIWSNHLPHLWELLRIAT